MNRSEIFQLVEEALMEICEVNDIHIEGEISEKTPLYGQRGYLDSLALVSLIASLEEKLSEKGYNITIASEKAFSRQVSPFLNVRTLLNFVEELINEVGNN